MPHTDSHAPGSFCWMELATTDQEGAKKFYADLFGWQPADFPMGPDEVYTMFKLEGRDAGACYTMQKAQREQGIPPNWLLYISTADVDKSTAKAKELGAKVMAGPFDVMTFGKMAVLQDPTGPVFALWQPLSHFGVGVYMQPSAFCWADVMSPDTNKAKAFYEGLFGWKLSAGEKDPSGYLHIENGSTMIGGMPPAEHQPSNTPPHWLLYFMVASCAESTEKLKSLGGRVYAGPMKIENVGTMSIVTDPQGAVFSLFEPSPRG